VDDGGVNAGWRICVGNADFRLEARPASG